eukprot:CAMPEP_0171265962 /NCGR_PEP_ID=MMETSP0790-20130122/58396_1 /TAXON_ID=2925 /ORGANISM="Alexandrium catenella, Strain OF101" /LENGTH=100 /DNA_ID=CAMNT_0011734649 /DNA_START=38 /DNA_END=336 /DNA_ORIENTATION=+
MATSQLLAQMYEGMAPLWVELMVLSCFLLGFAFLRLDTFTRKKPKKEIEPLSRSFDAQLKKVVEAESASGSAAAVLKAWRTGNAKAPTPQDILKSVVQAL